jgi:hypothetical protein
MLIQFSSYIAMMAAMLATYNWFNPHQNSPGFDNSEGKENCPQSMDFHQPGLTENIIYSKKYVGKFSFLLLIFA